MLGGSGRDNSTFGVVAVEVVVLAHEMGCNLGRDSPTFTCSENVIIGSLIPVALVLPFPLTCFVVIFHILIAIFTMHVEGLVNLALFLANAMAESIKTDSCDEVHWEKNDGHFAIANSCGQNGRNYGKEIW